MAVTELRIHDFSSEKLFEFFKEVKEEIQDLKKDLHPKQTEEYLTRLEVSKILKVHVNTVDDWTKKGLLQKYGISGRAIYYKRSEIEASIIPIK